MVGSGLPKRQILTQNPRGVGILPPRSVLKRFDFQKLILLAGALDIVVASRTQALSKGEFQCKQRQDARYVRRKIMYL